MNVPSPDKNPMTQRSIVSVWWQASRPFAFPASVMPVLLGVTTAWFIDNVPVHWFHLIVMVAGSMLLHAAANMLNDVYDYRKGVDRDGTFGSSGVLTHNLLSPGMLLTGGIICISLGAGIGLYFESVSGIGVLWIGLAGVSLAVFYTAGLELKYRALGDLSVFLAFGTLITLGAYYVQTSRFSWFPVVYSIPLGLLIDAILHGNNLRDIDDDAVVHVRTLAGRIGVRGSQYYYLLIVSAAFVSIPLLILFGRLPWTTLLTFFALPVAVKNMKTVFASGTLPKNQFAPIDASSAKLQMLFGLLMIAGIVLLGWIQ